MTFSGVISPKEVSTMLTGFHTQERAFGASTVFRVVASLQAPTLANQLPRRERWVLLLLDGRRTVEDLARLTQRNEFDVAYTLVRFLQLGYIEPIQSL
jgi:hypothetical protein